MIQILRMVPNITRPKDLDISITKIFTLKVRKLFFVIGPFYKASTKSLIVFIIDITQIFFLFFSDRNHSSNCHEWKCRSCC